MRVRLEANLEITTNDENIDTIPSSLLARPVDGGIDGIESSVSLCGSVSLC